MGKIKNFLIKVRNKLLGGSFGEIKTELRALRAEHQALKTVMEKQDATNIDFEAVKALLAEPNADIATLRMGINTVIREIQTLRTILEEPQAELNALRAELGAQIAQFELHKADQNNDHWNTRVGYDDRLSNLQLDLVDLFCPGNRERLKELYNSQKGGRCFVIDGGSDIKSSDLDFLKDNDVFCLASDGIYSMFTQTDWRPNIWGTSAPLDFLEDEDIRQALNGVTKWLPCQMAIEQSMPIENAIYYPQVTTQRIPFYFNMDLRGGTYSYIPITGTLINIAAFIGFSEIYLMGADDISARHRGTEIYKDIKRHCEAVGIRIYDTCLCNDLAAFEKVALEGIVGEPVC